MAKRVNRKRKLTPPQRPYIKIAIGAFLVLTFAAMAYHYRDGIAYYFGFRSDKTRVNEADRRLSDLRNIEVLLAHDGKSIGFDVSEYQQQISWQQIDSVAELYPLDYVFIRATAGNNRIDTRFAENWREAKKQHFIRGAYHYYRPNENSLEQAQNFIRTVKLQRGDFPPVLDIEQLPETQSVDSLKVGLRRWLKAVEKHYKVRPIIYSGEKYYDDFLKDEFSEYTFWIANYNFFVDRIKPDWKFWQFTEKATVKGISGDVDLNIFNGSAEELEKLTLRK